jgi:hypothetical protein
MAPREVPEMPAAEFRRRRFPFDAHVTAITEAKRISDDCHFGETG